MGTRQINLRLDENIISRYDTLADQHDRDRSYFLRKAIEDYVMVTPTKPKEPATSVQEGPDLFEQFWSAGMRKVGKKKAKSSFFKICARKRDKQAFCDGLRRDIQARLNSKQLGFTEMHPATYLNGERWKDDLIIDKHRSMTTRDMTLEQEFDRTWAGTNE